jgi:thiamine pyrophosphate-dependent acetolactate synthase large subunit-like protein
LRAREEVLAVAEKFAAPVAKALLGKAVIPDDSRHSLGGIGHLGTQASEWAMHHCDTVLILGSTMPWIDSYPKPGSAFVVGDGGFAQLRGELTTAVRYQLQVKIIILKNDSLAEVKFEQRELQHLALSASCSPGSRR